MDPFFWAATGSKLLQQGASILMVAIIVAALVLASERLFGLNIRGAIDVFEDMQQKARSGKRGGNPWPLTCLLIAGLLAIVWLVRV